MQRADEHTELGGRRAARNDLILVNGSITSQLLMFIVAEYRQDEDWILLCTPILIPLTQPNPTKAINDEDQTQIKF